MKQRIDYERILQYSNQVTEHANNHLLGPLSILERFDKGVGVATNINHHQIPRGILAIPGLELLVLKSGTNEPQNFKIITHYNSEASKVVRPALAFYGPPIISIEGGKVGELDVVRIPGKFTNLLELGLKRFLMEQKEDWLNSSF